MTERSTYTFESYEKAASNFKWRIAKEYNVSGVITLDGKITKKGGER